VSERRDWDRVHREERVLLRGSLPYWQDGWTSEIEPYVPGDINRPHLLLTSTFKGGFVHPLLSKWTKREYRVFRQETYCTGLSKVIRGWILEPLALTSNLPGSPSDPEYRAAMNRALKTFDQRLEEKALFYDLVATPKGRLKHFYRCKKLVDRELDLEFPDRSHGGRTI
jgi:hypothetical protein